MKILMINKFLYPNGGSESYIFKLGAQLKKQGEEVQYFGMDSENRCVGNNVNAYSTNIELRGRINLSKLTYPFKTVYSSQARKKIRLVLEDFCPDVCHLNNFNYQLTPSIILEIEKWKKERSRKCKIIYTAHDYQLVCPNHMCSSKGKNCEKCLSGSFWECFKGKCIHNSRMKSAVGAAEALFWKMNGVYKHIDAIVCCSEFMKKKLDFNPIFKEKTVVLHNFIENKGYEAAKNKGYVLYFGRFSEEKGIGTLLEVCRELKDIPFVFAGAGPMEKEVNGVQSIKNAGFQKGEALEQLIREAEFSVYPSQWYENCPLSVMESIACGTPVLGARIGGIPELIEEGCTGELFQGKEELKEKIVNLWRDSRLREEYARNCVKKRFLTAEEYVNRLMKLYGR